MTVASSHNGGRSQLNFNFAWFGYEYPFINFMKSAGTWSNIDGTGYPDPRNLDGNGYPTTLPGSGAGSSGISTLIYIPSQTERSGSSVVKWDGNGTVYLPNATSFTGSKTGSGGSGRLVWTPSATSINIGISALNGSSVTNLRICHSDDETAMDVGEIFHPNFIARLTKGARGANFGVLRFLNWASSNTTNVTTWATRKPTGYVYWHGQQLRGDIYCGTTTNSGDDYSVSAPSSWAGLADKATVSVKFNADQTSANATVTLTATVGNPIVVNWSGHTLSIGDPVGLIEFSGGATLPSPLFPGGSYYVSSTGFSAGTSFQVCASPGATSINCTVANGSGTINAIRNPTLNVGGTGAKPVKRQYGDPLTTGSNAVVSSTSARQFATLVYDAEFDCWLKFGGDAGVGNQGLQNGVPPEICLALCNELGAHAYLTVPFLALDPATDYVSSLAAYCAANQASWAQTRFECPPNECWNNGFHGTRYAWNKGNHQWGVIHDHHQWVGKVGSTAAQDVAVAYGGNRSTGARGDRSKYCTLSGVQTALGDTVSNVSGNYPRLTSAQYVAQAAAAQSGYNKDAAYKWLTHVNCAQYMQPANYLTNQELIDAYAYSVSPNVALLDNYIDGLTQSAATNSFAFTLPKLATFYQNWWDYSQGNLQTGGGWGNGAYKLGLMGYEGGYSADYGTSGVSSTISGATQDSQCVLTLASSSVQGASRTGNPAAVGMSISISNVVGMTQLNGNTYTIAKVGVADGLSTNQVAINVDATGFGVYASGGTATYVNALSLLTSFRRAAKNSVRLLYHLMTNYASFVAVGAQFPSCFQMGGGLITSNSAADTGGTWSVLDPDTYVTANPPQWDAIRLFNDGRVRLRAST